MNGSQIPRKWRGIFFSFDFSVFSFGLGRKENSVSGSSVSFIYLERSGVEAGTSVDWSSFVPLLNLGWLYLGYLKNAAETTATWKNKSI